MNICTKLLFIKLSRVSKYWYALPLILMCASCTPDKQVYQSDCDEQQTFKKVSFTNLLDSIKYYNQQYVEVCGRYQEGKNLSALYSDSTLVNINNNKAMWVNFSQDCALYLKGTQQGFFDYNNGEFNKKVRIRGKVDVRNQGHLKQYKGCIDHVSFIELLN